jgi:hypothetical protein
MGLRKRMHAAVLRHIVPRFDAEETKCSKLHGPLLQHIGGCVMKFYWEHYHPHPRSNNTACTLTQARDHIEGLRVILGQVCVG